MASADSRWERLVADLAKADAPEVLKEARLGARARVRAALEDALVDELTRAVVKPAGPARQEVHPEPAPDVRAEPAPGTRPAPAEDPGDAYWVYCVVPAERASELATGVDGVEPAHSVAAVVEGELGALTSRVPLSEYGDEQLRRHLEDITWLERTARAHEAVQETVMRHSPLVPLRMCTIYRDLDGVRRMLKQRSELFSENLAAVADSAEWGIKAFLDLRRAPAPSSAEPELASSSGADYLAGRQRERDRVREADELCLQCAEEVHRAVSLVAAQERINPAQSHEAHGRDAEMILNASYLVQHAQIEDLQDTVLGLSERWAPQGISVELTGPWPPYNFVSDSAGLMS